MTHMKDSLPFSSRILGQVLTLYILKNNAIIFLDLNIFLDKMQLLSVFYCSLMK